MPRKSGQTSDETKQRIKCTFMKLYKNKSIERITIDEISKEAGINRSTFYYYFEDIYALSIQVEEDFIKIVENTFPHILEGIFKQNFDENMSAFIEFYERYREQYLFFMVEKPNQRVIKTIQSFAQEHALKFLGLTKDELTIKQKLIVEYIAHAQMGIIGYWMEEGQEVSISELGELIAQINLQGAFPTLFRTIV